MASAARKQTGITLIGLLFWGALLASVVIVGIQAVPALQESWSVQRIVDKVAREGDSVDAIRLAFDRDAGVEYITSIAGRDLTITKVDGRVVVSYAYNKEIHLAGPAYLEFKFTGHSH